jgi:hypothetical protein
MLTDLVTMLSEWKSAKAVSQSHLRLAVMGMDLDRAREDETEQAYREFINAPNATERIQ